MFLTWTARSTLTILAVVTLLPFVPSGEWWIRIWDFPRLQIAALIVVPLVAITVDVWRMSRGQQSTGTGTREVWGIRYRREQPILFAAALSLAGWQLATIAPFTPIWPIEVRPADDTTSPIRILTVNIDYRNGRHQDMISMLAAQNADVVLLLEVDEKWAKALAPLDEEYPYKFGVVRGEGLGIVLWSRYPMTQKDVKYLVSDRRASLFVTLDVPGMGPLRYVGLHPTPPGLRDRIEHNASQQGRRDSRVRDAELVLVARQVRSDPGRRWIVTGDFNDVAWSDTTELFKELSGLKDPRIGRTLLNTYHAQWLFLRYPIDHVFVSDRLRLAAMKRVHAPGSDHFAIAATFAAARKNESPSGATKSAKDEGSDLVQEGKEDADERGAESR